MSAAQRSTRQLLALVFVSALLSTATAFENGPPPANTGGFGETDCSACHFDNPINASAGHLTLSGVPEIFKPGQRYAFSLSLDHPALIVGGFQLSVRTADGKPAGELTAHGSDVGTTRLDTTGVTYVQHSRPRDKFDAEIRWVVSWRAPNDEVAVVVNVAANAANNDASALGDFIYKASVVTAATESLATTPKASGPTAASSHSRNGID